MRREFSAKTKEQRYDFAQGCCEGCGIPLEGKRPEFDHDNPDGLTGDNSFENCRCLCRACHVEKTKRDIAWIAKAKRRARNAKGIKKKTKFRGWRTMSGKIVFVR